MFLPLFYTLKKIKTARKRLTLRAVWFGHIRLCQSADEAVSDEVVTDEVDCEVSGADEVSGGVELVGCDEVGVDGSVGAVEVVADGSGSLPPSTFPPLCSVHTGAYSFL